MKCFSLDKSDPGAYIPLLCYHWLLPRGREELLLPLPCCQPFLPQQLVKYHVQITQLSSTPQPACLLWFPTVTAASHREDRATFTPWCSQPLSHPGAHWWATGNRNIQHLWWAATLTLQWGCVIFKPEAAASCVLSQEQFDSCLHISWAPALQGFTLPRAAAGKRKYKEIRKVWQVEGCAQVWQCLVLNFYCIICYRCL